MVLGLRQKLGISVFIEKAPAAKLLSWHQRYGCHFVPFVMYICGAKFQEHCFNSFRDIVYSVFDHFLVANLMTSSRSMHTIHVLLPAGFMMSHSYCLANKYAKSFQGLTPSLTGTCGLNIM